ncbi:MAG: hypothetical protein WC494_02405 [Candidatus Pacearchaeota archaeon]
MSKRGEFNFVWLFAIIAGGAILILAVYGAFKFSETQKYEGDTEIAKSLATLTDPMQAGFAEGSYGKILFNQETRIRNICFEEGLGKNDISISTESGVGERWGEYGGAISVHNKYIFSDGINQGKEFYVFSKPFEFPYKVSDMIFLTEKEYCFTNAPKEISEEVSLLKIPNIRIDNCSEGDTIVCFGLGKNCDINVYGACMENCNSVYDEGTVEKNGEVMKYAGNLLYGAIFSEKEIYGCNVKRLLQRTGKIAELLNEKADLMNARDCSTNLQVDINVWRGLTQNATAEDIISLNQIAKNLNRRNVEQCSLW